MKKLSSIGVPSVFKMSLVLGSVAGLLVGSILMLVDFFNSRFLEGIVTLIMAPVLYGVLGGAVNALMALIYNLVAERLGGIEVNFED